MSDTSSDVMSRARTRRSWILSVFEVSVVVPTFALIGARLSDHRWASVRNDWAEILLWVALIAVVELMPIPMWRGTHIGMGFPLLMVVAFIYQPSAAAAAAFLAASDPREIRREVGVLRALFNRSQVALAVGASSLMFHSVASVEHSGALALLVGASSAALVDYLVNATLVCLAASIHYWIHPLRVIRELRVGRLTEFVVSYFILAVFGLVLAKVFTIEEVKFYAIPAFVIPSLLARQMFFRSKALEEAHTELKDREQVLRALSNRMAEERQDERQQIAAFLHDDLAQLLFRLSIQVDVARRHLEAGKLGETEKVLGEIKDTKNQTSERIRTLIRDLDRSPLGRAGLAEALHSFIAETGRDADVAFHTDIDEIEVPAPIALLLYKIAKEGVMNALKHAGAQNMWLSVKSTSDEVTMNLRDDGVGYDVDAPEPEGHFGLTMMRERAMVGRGTYEVSSAPGKGTSITVRFPTSWLQETTTSERDARVLPAPDRDGVGHDSRPTPVNAPAGSVPA